MAYKGIEAGIYARLRDNAGVASLVSGRVYPSNLPKNAVFPAVHFRRSSADRGVTVEGNDGYVKATLTITAMAPSYDQVKALANAIRLAMIGFSGTQGDHQVAGTYLENDVDEFYSDLQHNGEAGVYGVVMSYTIQYYE